MRWPWSKPNHDSLKDTLTGIAAAIEEAASVHHAAQRASLDDLRNQPETDLTVAKIPAPALAPQHIHALTRATFRFSVGGFDCEVQYEDMPQYEAVNRARDTLNLKLDDQLTKARRRDG